MISLTRAEVLKRESDCNHARSLTGLPGSGSLYFCNDCGTYFGMFDYPKSAEMTIGRWRDYILGKDNAFRLW